MPKAQYPKYRHHKASGQGVVTLSGQDYYLGPHGTEESYRRYDEAITQWLARGRRPVEVEALVLSVDDLIETYLKWAEGYYRDRDGQPNRKELYHVKRALEPLHEGFGLTAAADFGPRKLEVVRDRFIADGLARTLTNKYTQRIKHVFRLGVQKELVPGETWHRLAALENLKRGRSAAHETEPIKPVDDAFVDAIKPYVSRQVWAMIEVQRFTGMRPGEVCIMRGADLDTSGALWQHKPQHHKTEHHGKARVIMLGARAQEILRPFLKADLAAYLFTPREADQERRKALTKQRKTPLNQGNRVGSNRRRKPRRCPGERYTRDSYRRAIAYGCDLADKAARAQAIADGKVVEPDQRFVPQWHPNQLRHGYATRVRKEFGLDAAQIMLGHSKADVTQVYAERDQALAAQVALKIG